MPLFRAPLLLLLLTTLYCTAVLAQTDNCPTQPTRDQRVPLVRRAPPPKDAPTYVHAQKLRSQKNGVAELEGNAEVSRGGERVSGDFLRFDSATNTASAQGNVEFRDAVGNRFTSDHLQLQLDTHIGATGPSRYVVNNGLARGDAARIEFDGPDHTRLTEARYTTCREGRNDWFLNVDRLDLDHVDDVGTAYHTTIDFFGMPVFYFPYVNFPISDRRKSGFLFPRAGHSDRRGYEFSAPYYFNLAPNYDATLTPHYMSRHGLKLESEFRYLTRDSKGFLQMDYLEDDRVTQDDRAAGLFQHQQTLNPLWSTNVDVRGVSDKDYFTDFGDRLSLTSQTHLAQSADLTYRGSYWLFSSRLSDYQTIDKQVPPAGEPYARLPQLILTSTMIPLPNEWSPQMDAEWSRFRHVVNLLGERFNLNTGLSLPLQNEWGFVTPKIGARYISYQLERDSESSLSLARPLASLDSGVIFERDTLWGQREMVQTLEPRLFYLYVPYKNHDSFPMFDTGVPDLSFAGLFRENRFTGGDRIGDANQVTAAISTRFFDTEEGMERLRLSLGRIYYLDPPQVNVPPGPGNRSASDVIAEASAWLFGNWHARETVQWNRHDDRVERNSFYLQYQPAYNKILNLGYVSIHNQPDQPRQYDISTEWPVGGPWSVRARSLRDIRNKRDIETYAGVEYNACCWAARVMASRRWRDTEHVNAIMFELQLIGLSKFGKVPDSPLKQGLFSFANEPRDSSEPSPASTIK